MMRIRSVEHLGDHRLRLSFSDGTSGEVDLNGHLDGPALRALQDVQLFAKAYVDVGTVCWPGNLDLAPEYLYALAHSLKPPKTFEDAKRNEQAVTLRELRELAGLTQNDVAGEMGVAQGEISRLERREDAKLSTLRAYVEALGGRLELTAKVGDRSVALQAFLPTTRPSSKKLRPAKKTATRRKPRSATGTTIRKA